MENEDVKLKVSIESIEEVQANSEKLRRTLREAHSLVDELASLKIGECVETDKSEVVNVGLYQDYNLTLKSKYGAKEIDESKVKKVILIYSEEGKMTKRTINNQALEKQIQLFKEKYGSKCLDFLTPNLKTEIIRVIKNGKPVIISNDYGRTGKTTLKLFIRSLGGIAYEEWECKKITLKNPL